MRTHNAHFNRTTFRYKFIRFIDSIDKKLFKRIMFFCGELLASLIMFLVVFLLPHFFR